MFGRWVAALIVVGLAIGVWALWPDSTTDTTTTTTPEAAPTTATSSSSTVTTTPTTTTSTGSPGLIDTVEEAEEVLRNLWFGWFEGIYNQDEDRIKEVVASQNQLDRAISQFGTMTFDGLPTPAGLTFADTEILLSTTNCAAIWASLEVAFRNGSTEGVHLLRYHDGTWLLLNLWPNRNDLWEQDCDGQVEPLS